MRRFLAGPALALLAVPALAILAACATTTGANLPTQPGIDLQRYAGTWYEQARLPNQFQEDCIGDVRAEYRLKEDDRITVINQCRIRDGSLRTVEGEGRLSRAADPRDPAILEVRFAPAWTSWLPMVWGDYWIIRLEGDYEYSLVGTPDRKYLWVLSREPQADPAVVERLLEHAGQLGFKVDEVVKKGS